MFFLGIRKIYFYQKIIINTQSSNLQVDLKWLQWMMIIFVFTLFLDIISQFLIALDFADDISLTHLSIFFSG